MSESDSGERERKESGGVRKELSDDYGWEVKIGKKGPSMGRRPSMLGDFIINLVIGCIIFTVIIVFIFVIGASS